MSEHLTQNQVENYCLQQLCAADLLLVSDHLGECEACRRRIEAAMNGDASFLAVRSEVFSEAGGISGDIGRMHPTAEQTAGFVDGSLAGEEHQVIADHLIHCEQCALAADDLRAFKNEIVPSLEREYRPAPVSLARGGWWHRMAASLPAVFQGSPGLALGAALTVLLLAVTGWLVWRTAGPSEPKDEVVVSPTPQPQPGPAPDAVQLVAELKDGEGRLTLDREGTLSGADELLPAYRSMLTEALTSRRIERSPQLKGLARPPSSLMSVEKQGSEFFVIEPVGKVLMTARPTFRWSSLEGATGYIVEVYDSKFNLVAASPQLANPSWAPPHSLPRGGVYSWQVKAIKDGDEVASPRPPAPQARFRILDLAKATELARAKRDYGSSHLALGLLYAEAGLLKEAEQELRALQKANPDSEIVRTLLNQVQALRR